MSLWDSIAGSKSSNKWNSSTTSKPKFEKNHETIANDAMDLYKRGIGGGVYQGERVPDQLSEQTQQGQGNLDNIFLNSNRNTYSEDNLKNIAEGNYLNPYFQQNLQNQLDAVRDTVNRGNNLSTSGQQSLLSKSLGDVATNAYSDQFNKNTQYQMQANQQLDDSRLKKDSFLQGLANNQIQSGLLNTYLQMMQNQANKDKFDEEQMNPWKLLSLLGGATITADSGYSNVNSSGSATSKQTDSPLGAIGSIVGGIAGGPIGGAIGKGIGGIFG